LESAERAFFQAVEARVTAARGRGYALSGLDAQVVAGWWQRGCPLALVLASVEKAAREAARRGAAERLSIHAVGREVDALMARRSRAGMESEAADDADAGEHRSWLLLKQLVEDVGRRLDDGPVREWWRRLWVALVRDEQGGGDPWVFATEMDAALLRELSAQVPESVRTEALREASVADGYREASPKAREALESLAVGRAIRTYLGVPELMEALLHR
jgi:hypothetical protein